MEAFCPLHSLHYPSWGTIGLQRIVQRAGHIGVFGSSSFIARANKHTRAAKYKDGGHHPRFHSFHTKATHAFRHRDKAWRGLVAKLLIFLETALQFAILSAVFLCRFRRYVLCSIGWNVGSKEWNVSSMGWNEIFIDDRPAQSAGIRRKGIKHIPVHLSAHRYMISF